MILHPIPFIEHVISQNRPPTHISDYHFQILIDNIPHLSDMSLLYPSLSPGDIQRLFYDNLNRPTISTQTEVHTWLNHRYQLHDNYFQIPNWHIFNNRPRISTIFVHKSDPTQPNINLYFDDREFNLTDFIPVKEKIVSLTFFEDIILPENYNRRLRFHHLISSSPFDIPTTPTTTYRKFASVISPFSLTHLKKHISDIYIEYIHLNSYIQSSPEHQNLINIYKTISGS